MKTLILASQSPRRRELLEKAGFEFCILPVKVSEILKENLNRDKALMGLAKEKAQALVQSNKLPKSGDFLILAADTIVLVDERILGKPANPQEALDFLRLLSGRRHEVKTAICFWDTKTGKFVTEVDTTEVFFNDLTEEQLTEYVASKNPMDKAGAYGIQELPEGFLNKIVGEFDNVVGLPVKRVERLLEENGWTLPRRIN